MLTHCVSVLVSMAVLGSGFMNLYSPADDGPALYAGGWATAADPDDYTVALEAGADPTAIAGPDKVYRLTDGGPELALEVIGAHVNDPTIIAPTSAADPRAGAPATARSTWRYMYYTRLANDAADEPLMAHRVGFAVSADSGATWRELAVLKLLDFTPTAWMPSAFVRGDEIWLYFGDHFGHVWRARLGMAGWKLIEPPTLTNLLVTNVDVRQAGDGFVAVANSYDLHRIRRYSSTNGIWWSAEETLVESEGLVLTPRILERPDGYAVRFGYDPTGLMGASSIHEWTFRCE